MVFFQTSSLVFGLAGVFVVYIVGYVVHQRFFHPLAIYPGPFLASLTDLWQVYQFSTLKQPYYLTHLHAKYGTFVRYGPDKLSVTSEDAIPTIYQKGGKSMPKTEFYDAFGSARPNIFGMRDEAVSSKIGLLQQVDWSGLGLPKACRCIPFADATCHTVSPSLTSRKWKVSWTPISTT